MRGKIIASIALLLVIGGCFTYAASPFFAARALSKAAKNGDVHALDRLVDYPAVKDSLKIQFTQTISSAMEKNPELVNNPFAGLALAMIPTIVDQAIDQIVTPNGIANMMQAEKSSPKIGSISVSKTKKSEENVDYSYAYSALDYFKATTRSKSDPRVYVEFGFERRNLFSWKLVKIQMSEDLLNQSSMKPEPSV